MCRPAISFTQYRQSRTQGLVDHQYLKSPHGRSPIFKSSTPPSSIDRTSFPSAYEVFPNRLQHPLCPTANPMAMHVNLDLKHPLAYLEYLDYEQGARHSLVEDHSTYPVLPLYDPSTPPDIRTISAQSLPPTMASPRQKVRRLIERSSSVLGPRKNKTTGTTSSEVLLVQDNQVQRGVTVVCRYLSLTSMKLERDIEGLVPILPPPCIPTIDLPRRTVGCRMVRLGIRQLWTRGA